MSMFVQMCVRAHVRMCANVCVRVSGRAPVPACACVNARYASFYHRIYVIANMKNSLIN